MTKLHLLDGPHARILKVLCISFTQEKARTSGFIFQANTKSMSWCQQRIYTDANLYDSKEFAIITESADQILTQLQNQAQDLHDALPDDVELVLEIVPFQHKSICGYYFVNHSRRCLFWLEKFDASGICDDVKAVVSLPHLREHRLEL